VRVIYLPPLQVPARFKQRSPNLVDRPKNVKIQQPPIRKGRRFVFSGGSKIRALNPTDL
jgi:hypothetical protein